MIASPLDFQQAQQFSLSTARCLSNAFLVLAAASRCVRAAAAAAAADFASNLACMDCEMCLILTPSGNYRLKCDRSRITTTPLVFFQGGEPPCSCGLVTFQEKPGPVSRHGIRIRSRRRQHGNLWRPACARRRSLRHHPCGRLRSFWRRRNQQAGRFRARSPLRQKVRRHLKSQPLRCGAQTWCAVGDRYWPRRRISADKRQ